VAGLTFGASCTKEPADAAAAPVAQGSPVSSPEPDARAVPIRLTDQKLSAYLAYQRRMLQLYATRLDGGDTRLSAPKLAEAEEEARKQSGLERAELAAIELMVRAVIGKRLYGATPPGDDSLERMKALREKLSGKRREELARSIAELETSRDEFARLTEERRKYGDANIDLVLAREPELRRAWKEMMATFAPRPQR
jgi:hypothetical protein